MILLVSLPLTALALSSCRPSDIQLRVEAGERQIVATFYKRGFFGEYRVRPCVYQAMIERADRQIVWHVRAPLDPISSRTCQQLDALTVPGLPNGWIVEVPFDAASARGSATLSVASLEGDGTVTFDMGSLR